MYQDHEATGSWVTVGEMETYSGGGFVANLGQTKEDTDKILKYLHESLWLDEYSRAVLVELAMYNTNANFYILVSFLAEFTSAGGAIIHKKVLTTRLDRYSSGFAIFLATCEILFLALTVYYMYREVSM